MKKRKLGEDQVREIRKSQASLRELAGRFHVSLPTILNVKRRRTYKDVPDHSDDPLDSHLILATDLYLRKEALDFLKSLPTGSCPTVVTSPPTRLSASAVRQYGTREARRIYADWQREIIRECIRVAGPEGIFLYHLMAGASKAEGLDTKYELVTDFAKQLRRIIIWDHLPPRWTHWNQWGQMNSDGMFWKRDAALAPTGGAAWAHDAPATYSFIYAFTGVNWSMPEEMWLAAWVPGDVWAMEPIFEHGDGDGDVASWVSFPDQLADRCVALGKGIVLNPFAAAGAIPLAAIRAGRNWLACDTRPMPMGEFENRRAMAEKEARAGTMKVIADRYDLQEGEQLISSVNYVNDP